MARPSKSTTILKMEGKSHRTKAELAQRENGEKSLITGIKLKEKEQVKSNLVAHKEFIRLQKLFSIIEKNDSLFENIVNRYCELYSECLDFQHKFETFLSSLNLLEDECGERISNGELTWLDYMKLRSNYQTQIINLDKQVQVKREMLLKIERECLMTIASALRAVPKKLQEEEDPDGDMFG